MVSSALTAEVPVGGVLIDLTMHREAERLPAEVNPGLHASVRRDVGYRIARGKEKLGLERTSLAGVGARATTTARCGDSQ